MYLQMKGRNLSRDEIESQFHGEARLQIALSKMEGYQPNKKAARFNTIVEVAIRYGRCSLPFSLYAACCGLIEAVEACCEGIPEMYIEGEGPLSLCGEWMLVVE